MDLRIGRYVLLTFATGKTHLLFAALDSLRLRLKVGGLTVITNDDFHHQQHADKQRCYYKKIAKTIPAKKVVSSAFNTHLSVGIVGIGSERTIIKLALIITNRGHTTSLLNGK
jgi:Ni2+-binding GTPase involved in maturation of urease and hydrogenase